MVKLYSLSQLSFGLFVVLAGSLAGLIAAGVIGVQLPLILLGALIALIVLPRNVNLGLAALVFMVYINLSDVLIEHHGLPSIAKAYLPFIILLVSLEWLRSGRQPFLPRDGLAVLGIYATVLMLSLFYAPDHERVATGLVDFVKNVMIAVALALLISRPEHFRVALWGIIGGAFFLAAINGYKFLTSNFANEYGGFAQSGVAFIVDDKRQYRISGVMSDPNYFAQLLLIAVPISFERMISESARWLKFAAGSTLLLSLMVIVLTFSRGALLSLVVLAGIALLFVGMRRNWLLLAALLVTVSLPLLPAGYLDRISTAVPLIDLQDQNRNLPDKSIRGRAGEMRVAWEMFLDHPIVGVGFNNYELYFQQYTIEFDQMPRGSARPAHSLYLEVAAERGLLGLGSLALLLLYFARLSVTGYRSLAEAGRCSQANMIAGLAAGFTGYLIAAIFLHDAYSRYFWLLAGLLLAVPGMLRTALSENQSGDNPA